MLYLTSAIAWALYYNVDALGYIQGTLISMIFFFFSSRRRHTRFDCDWSSDVCSSDLRHVRLREPGDRRAARLAHPRGAGDGTHLPRDGADRGGRGVDPILAQDRAVGGTTRPAGGARPSGGLRACVA